MIINDLHKCMQITVLYYMQVDLGRFVFDSCWTLEHSYEKSQTACRCSHSNAICLTMQIRTSWNRDSETMGYDQEIMI